MTDEETAAALGFTQQALQRVVACPSLSEGAALLDDLKREAKRRHRQLALEHHPDRTGGDDSVMKTLNRVMGEIEKLVVKPRPQPIIRFVDVRWSSGGASSGTSTTTSWTWR